MEGIFEGRNGHGVTIRKWNENIPLDFGAEVIPDESPFGYAAYAALTREDALGLALPLRVLDMGHGQGNLVRYLRKKEIEAYGVDKHEHRLVPADNSIFFNEDMRHTHFTDDFFDVVMDTYMFAQLDALEHDNEVLPEITEEMRRVIRPDGYYLSIAGGPPQDKSLDNAGFRLYKSYPSWYQAFQLSK